MIYVSACVAGEVVTYVFALIREYLNQRRFAFMAVLLCELLCWAIVDNCVTYVYTGSGSGELIDLLAI